MCVVRVSLHYVNILTVNMRGLRLSRFTK